MMKNKFQWKAMHLGKVILLLFCFVQQILSQQLKDECGILRYTFNKERETCTINGRILTPEYEAAEMVTVRNLYDTVLTDSAGKFSIRFPATADTFFIIICGSEFVNLVIIFPRSCFKAEEFYTVFTNNIILRYPFYSVTTCTLRDPYETEKPRRLSDRIFRNRVK